jgi:hypothetical protein
MKQKGFGEYMDRLPPTSVQLTNTASLLAVLKMFGEIPRIGWGFIIFLWVAGLVVRLVKAAHKQATDEPVEKQREWLQ